MSKQELAEQLLDIGVISLKKEAILEGEKPRIEDVKINTDVLMGYPESRKNFLNAFEAALKEHNAKIDGFAAISFSGMAFAAWLSEHLKKGLMYIHEQELEGEKVPWVEGFYMNNYRVGFVLSYLDKDRKDVIEIIKTLKRINCIPTHCLTIIDFDNETEIKAQFDLYKIKIISLITLEELLEEGAKKKIFSRDKEIYSIERCTDR